VLITPGAPFDLFALKIGTPSYSTVSLSGAWRLRVSYVRFFAALLPPLTLLHRGKLSHPSFVFPASRFSGVKDRPLHLPLSFVGFCRHVR